MFCRFLPIFNISFWSLVCLLLGCFPPNVFGARILGFFPSSYKSHQIVHCSIANTLAKAGHNVTVLGGTSNVIKNSLYKHISIKGAGFNANFTSDLINNRQSVYQKFNALMSNVVTSSNESMSSVVMKNFLEEHGEGSFDLLIIGYFMNNFHLGLGGHFKCPMIISLTMQPISPINILIGNPSEMAYVPTVFSGLMQPMNFMQRVMNFISNMLDRYGLQKLIMGPNIDLYEHHFPASQYPSFKEVSNNVSLVFSNHHSISQGPIRPNVPSLVEIGGIQIKEKPDPLPRDIAEIMDNAKNGVIYLSFGSYVQGSAIALDKAKAIFKVLSTLPYTILWKWEDLSYPGVSKNIIYKNWLPQDDILAHSNLKLFITHGGYGSIVESQYHGVPMVAIPLYGDQFVNAVNMVKNGFGQQLDYNTLTEENFRNAIETVLNNSEYRTTVQKYAILYRDRPISPSQTVVYWTEYVLRHHGAQHIKSPAVLLNEFQLLSLDVICFLISIVFGLLLSIYKCIHLLFARRQKIQITFKESKDQKKNKIL